MPYQFFHFSFFTCTWKVFVFRWLSWNMVDEFTHEYWFMLQALSCVQHLLCLPLQTITLQLQVLSTQLSNPKKNHNYFKTSSTMKKINITNTKTHSARHSCKTAVECLSYSKIDFVFFYLVHLFYSSFLLSGLFPHAWSPFWYCWLVLPDMIIHLFRWCGRFVTLVRVNLSTGALWTDTLCSSVFYLVFQLLANWKISKDLMCAMLFDFKETVYSKKKKKINSVVIHTLILIQTFEVWNSDD